MSANPLLSDLIKLQEADWGDIDDASLFLFF